MSPTRTHHDRRIGNGITIYFALVSDARACTARSIRGSSQRDCEACEVLGAWLGRTRPKIERVVPCVLHPQTRASGVKELSLKMRRSFRCGTPTTRSRRHGPKAYAYPLAHSALWRALLVSTALFVRATRGAHAIPFLSIPALLRAFRVRSRTSR